MNFNITSNFLPLHHFTEFKGYEIKNRYECFVNKQPEPCMHFCNQLRVYETNITNADIWDCYKRLKIPEKEYGREKCA